MYAEESIFNQLTLEEMATLKKKEIKSKIGRDLTFREWLTMKVVKAKHRKMEKRIQREQQNPGKKTDMLSLASLFFALIGFGLSWIPNAIAFIGLLIGLVGGILALGALLNRGRYENRKGKGLAIIAILVGLSAAVVGGIIGFTWFFYRLD